ncbi:hypothetical protein NliqN6_3789 [Naganishia liquefaciens]|uniref:Kinase n=1 Tax=Naganishia liquefaciens TaxID=104408 RepID=A0A8H3YGN1_9TREE|nr:hypothetical protein NliqN6_3789 [Naganishia liquefaciens]
MSSTPSTLAGETTASTSYKARIITEHIQRCLKDHRHAGRTEPLMVALQGPQGSGKTTVSTALLSLLAAEPHGLRVAAFSLDDLYLPHAGLVAVRDSNPQNRLLAGRGLPGTHDVALGYQIFSDLRMINSEADKPRIVRLPIFDKSLFAGEGDRSSQTVAVPGPVDVVLFEGWSVGFCPLDDMELQDRYTRAAAVQVGGGGGSSRPAFLSHTLADLKTVNSLLRNTAEQLWGFFTVFIQLELANLSQIYHWRLEQEHAMMLRNGGIGMTDDQVKNFVDRYLPGYELWMEGIKTGTFSERWKGRGLSLVYGPAREVLEVRHF